MLCCTTKLLINLNEETKKLANVTKSDSMLFRLGTLEFKSYSSDQILYDAVSKVLQMLRIERTTKVTSAPNDSDDSSAVSRPNHLRPAKRYNLYFQKTWSVNRNPFVYSTRPQPSIWARQCSKDDTFAREQNMRSSNMASGEFSYFFIRTRSGTRGSDRERSVSDFSSIKTEVSQGKARSFFAVSSCWIANCVTVSSIDVASTTQSPSTSVHSKSSIVNTEREDKLFLSRSAANDEFSTAVTVRLPYSKRNLATEYAPTRFSKITVRCVSRA
ncbi:hypothetical protein OGATHE_005608 [Ogataea polymorpha]|uniref:Uncharacterized protein n=1 Tax=Ogataea polymorpha TaxID=460523 RepID=A0A9P8NTI5_9ASCO|nr:hypothetical protein OGATHE_005608 [Ogataea polymorpha]